MLKWIQGGISAVTGIAEPEYGNEYIHTVIDRVKGKQPFHTTTKKDFYWRTPDYTNVETSTFYFTDLSNGNVGFAQVIHSNIVGLHTTAQFTFKLFNKNCPENNIWTSTRLENFRIEGANFYADNLSIEMNEQGDQVRFVSTVNECSELDLTFQRNTSGVKVGDDPCTYYGADINQPWGSMRHVFWPRTSCYGQMKIKPHGSVDSNIIEFQEDQPAYSMFVMALQGMKPHHAAKSWNFLNFHSKEYSVILMEFTTPRSYMNTKVSIGIICNSDEVLAVTTNNNVQHINSSIDSVGWPVPSDISICFNGVRSNVSDEEVENADKFTALVTGTLDNLVERVDVMAEIPTFVKNIVSGVVGTKPYIYQYSIPMNLTICDTNIVGQAWCEITFISEIETCQLNIDE